MYEYISHSEQDTIAIANHIAKQLHTGDILILSGDLGSGKTKFTEGILSYFGLENEISSPTFTIVNEYQTKKDKIYHFDVYRLSDIDEFYAIGGEEYFEKGICIVEWGEMIESILPPNYIKIAFSRTPEEENTRKLQITFHGNTSLTLEKEV